MLRKPFTALFVALNIKMQIWKERNEVHVLRKGCWAISIQMSSFNCSNTNEEWTAKISCWPWEYGTYLLFLTGKHHFYRKMSFLCVRLTQFSTISDTDVAFVCRAACASILTASLSREGYQLLVANTVLSGAKRSHYLLLYLPGLSDLFILLVLRTIPIIK